MGRPLKKQLSYFPLDTRFGSDLKIRRLIMKHGAEAVSVYLVLVGNIYATDGYFLVHSDDLYADIAFVLQLTEEKVKAIVDTCLRIGLFDAGKMEKWNIYTSYGIQVRFDAISSRSSVTMDSRYLMARMKKELGEKADVSATKTRVSATKTTVSVAKTPVFAATIPPKENKKKKTNENKTTKTVDNEKRVQANKAIAGTAGAGSDANSRLAELQRLFDAATGEQHA